MTPIEFAFDYASPWGFIASASAAERFRGLEVKYVPAYLRAFDAFEEGVPYAPAKLAYLMQDSQRTLEHLGIRVRHPTSFPIDGVHALRGAIAAEREGAFERYHRAMFSAAWQDDRDVSNKEDRCRAVRSGGAALPRAAEIERRSLGIRADVGGCVDRFDERGRVAEGKAFYGASTRMSAEG